MCDAGDSSSDRDSRSDGTSIAIGPVPGLPASPPIAPTFPPIPNAQRLDDLATVAVTSAVQSVSGRPLTRASSMIQYRRDDRNGGHALVRFGSAPADARLRPDGDDRDAAMSPVPAVRASEAVRTAVEGGSAPLVPAAAVPSAEDQISHVASSVLLPSLATKVSRSEGSLSRMQSAVTRLIAMPLGPLTSHVTYSDLPDGYEPVARGVEAVSEQRNGETVYVAKHWVQFREDPDSVAAIVAVEGATPGTLRPEVAITHRKLRYILRDAVKWYLQKQGLRVRDAHMIFGVKETDEAELQRALPKGLSNISVDAGRLSFDSPVVLQLSESQVGIRVIVVHAAVYAAIFATVLAIVHQLSTIPNFKVVVSALVSAYRVAVIFSVFMVRVIGYFLSPSVAFLQAQLTRVCASGVGAYRFVWMQVGALLAAVQEEIADVVL